MMSAHEGTRFRLFAQPPFVPGYERPERVRLRAPAGSIASGPGDARMYVTDALDKPWPYAFPYMPPFHGAIGPAAEPSPAGHFDHLAPNSRAFASAHLFASASHVVEIWEGYGGHVVPWHFHQPRLELVPLLDWDNAQAGYGFVETGFGTATDGTLWPFALSFDVVAHEIGHLLLYSLVGLPDADAATPAFGGFHESAADLIALVSLLHFDTVIARVIARSAGNLYVDNELNRFGELSASSEIRNASNSLTLDDVADESDIHLLSLVLTGAFFDVLSEAFLLRLHELDVIDGGIVALSRATTRPSEESPSVAAALAAASGAHPDLFHRALGDARDFLGRRLALTFEFLAPDSLTYERVAGTFLAADAAMTGSRGNWGWLATNFTWRKIEPKIPANPVVSRPIYPYRRIADYPEPYELQHSCALRARRNPLSVPGD